jgi:hypothetical protein
MPAAGFAYAISQKCSLHEQNACDAGKSLSKSVQSGFLFTAAWGVGN